MTSFTPAALIGLCIGFMWGIGCSLAILYSIYLGGYRKGVEESLQPKKSPRYVKALERIQQRQDQSSAGRTP
jgi:hypothetical protein